ncbi:HpcH/HpaI aldolase/citrate lyase family protein [Aliikangiella maris]|uniref:CoA ester lyase n=2 Tax=Aliikangiella maris TaxID=3162458 RepID=A0ABV2BV47_9GAMM
MTFQYQPRRTMLYVPAHRMRYLEKAKQLKADSLIFDLQESVPPDYKNDARNLLQKQLSGGQIYQAEKIIRINSLDSPWGMDDLKMVLSTDVDGILFPNIDSAGQLKAVISTLDESGSNQLDIMVNIESAKAIINCESICAASDRLSTIILGTTDLANSLRVTLNTERLALITSLSLAVLAARAHNKFVIDGPHLDLSDFTSSEFSCRQARDLGFDGKAVIHPTQLAYTNDAFTPKGDDVKKAKQIIEAIAQAHESGNSVAVIHNRLIEPSLEHWARRIIALYNQVHQVGQTDLIGPEK